MDTKTPAKQILSEAIAELQNERVLALKQIDDAQARIAQIDADLADLGATKPSKRFAPSKIKETVTTASNTVVDKTKKEIGKIRFKRIGFTLLAILAAVLILAPVTSIPIIQPYGWMIWLLTITAIILFAIPSKKKE